ncbi:DNA polymerase III subunit gamma/tau [Pseudodesulfovibrio piezophilus]|uniref:DNA polymerase III subunit gamma/tau n=1 Tax=Pseudodesulfovibrio piezophilus (strain DSM 21447 / JCM 15486 / C1TLV30) TaxID=1322246 RepID=M1WJ91_PSEP2|nr:DNA polymerase III subunit gamma/tau [Pseudodesulfovibrio piezophilus]CCH47486.1 DNA polymerase III, subunits gamma and tau [Pseudodesulfovibrio piezophilus C1TLV30]
MSTSNLTAKYRPQTFSDVAGQDAIKAILSRAAATDKVAPAYLFSGTRGVGKTTIARIFAKALNCVNAPTAEPCNVCSNCKQITAGVAVDVIEIDGASNRGIDDARRLKEDIGYAPVECRYKVFIIDEAHMLTKEAFNALLKTLEEPPPRATFIMATTEPHKFPATIISRCQHYIYKMLSQSELVTHLENIMNMEELPFEPGALQIIAKRGAGSVRDSMSLLGQSLAMGTDVLREEDVRSFLGLAGQDVFFQLMAAMHSRDLVEVGMVLRQVLDQGLDLGFFLRELTNCWRNMFLLRQAGDAALPLLGFSGEEAVTWKEWAGKFEAAHIHACWQMTLDGQRKVMTSLEPALALELLLLNLTCLPDLINLEAVGSSGTGNGSTPPRPNPSGAGGSFGGQHGGGPGNTPRGGTPPYGGQRFNAPAQSAGVVPSAQQGGFPSRQNHVPNRQEHTAAIPSPSAGISVPPRADGQGKGTSVPEAGIVSEEPHLPPSARILASSPQVSRPRGARDWNGFLDFVNEHNGNSPVKAAQLRLNNGELQGDELVITCGTRMQCSQLSESPVLMALESLTKDYFGPTVEVTVKTGDIAVRKSDRQLKEEAEVHPGVTKIMEAFSAQLISVSPRKQ